MSEAQQTDRETAPGGGLLIHPVVAWGLVLVIGQIALRSWASYGGWFYADDLELMTRLHDAALTTQQLFTPHDSQLMPGGILLAWLVAHSGPFNWTVAATILVAWQAAASLACLWALLTIFGKRWAVLPLLSIYLLSPLTLTAFMWWAAAINQLPMHTATFLGIGSAVVYLRTRRFRWLILMIVALGVGLLFYVKTVLILLVIALIALFFFSTPADPAVAWHRRLASLTKSSLKTYAALWVALFVVGLGYSAYYATHVTSPLLEGSVPYRELLDQLVRVDLGTGLLGGPWRWENANPPVAWVDPPQVAVVLAWVLIALTVAHWQRTRTLAWRAMVILLGYFAVGFLLIARGRGTLLGAAAGLELRYLADIVPVVVLCLGFFVLGASLRDDPMRPVVPVEATTRRLRTRLLRRPATWVVPLLVVGAILSTVRYVSYWHQGYPARSFAQRVIAESRSQDLTLVDAPVPEKVLSGISFPNNLPSRMFAPLGSISTPPVGHDLQILSDQGEPRKVLIDQGPRSVSGPAPGCGWKLRSGSVDIPLSGPVVAYDWWMRLGYLAPHSTPATIQAGDTLVETDLRGGLNSLFIKNTGGFDSVRISGLDPGVTVCVDSIEVGTPKPGAQTP